MSSDCEQRGDGPALQAAAAGFGATGPEARRGLVARVRLLRAGALLVCCALASSACGGRAQAQPDDGDAPPVTSVPVGPLPGPAEYQEATANPYATDLPALREGRQVFTAYNCAGCHGDHGGGGMGPSLRDERWLFGNAHEQIAQSIAEGRAHGMPAWRQMLTPAQVWKVTAYIKSMRTPEEPDPPQ
jgi:cytochrome c oxidase cbb3-type subunit 3